MSENAFYPVVSTDEVWRGEDANRCLTDDLVFIENDIAKIKDAVFNIDLAESDSNGLWRFKKYGDGIVECWAAISVSGVFDKSYCNVKYNEIEIEYPVEFTDEIPHVYATAECEHGIPNVSVCSNTKNKLKLRVSNPADLDLYVNVHVYAVGKWK